MDSINGTKVWHKGKRITIDGGGDDDLFVGCSWLLSISASIHIALHVLLHKTTEVKIQLSMKHERDTGERERERVYVCAGVCALVSCVIFQSGHIFLQCPLCQINIQLD